MKLLAAIVLSCLWSHGTDLRGTKFVIDDLDGPMFVQALNEFDSRAEWQSRKEERDRDPDSRRDTDRLNDYAVVLVHLGQLKPAIDMLLDIEKRQPGAYYTAANLGTAYELAGDVDKAHFWISAAIRRHPESHYGTEWLHVRILDAKRALAADPNWLKTHSVLGIDFGNGPIPKRPEPLPPGNLGQKLTLERVKRALFYQLDERYEFVKAPDPLVGSLLFDWANIFYRTETLESAIALYEEAIRFGAPRSELAKIRLARARQILRDHEQRNRRRK